MTNKAPLIKVPLKIQLWDSFLGKESGKGKSM
jgi:hypothetical protein